LNINTN
jgi:hypothetical protein